MVRNPTTEKWRGTVNKKTITGPNEMEVAMKTTKMRLILFGLVALLLAAGGSMAIGQKKAKVTPIKGFPDASLTIFPLTFYCPGLQDMKQEHRAWIAAFERGFLEEARPFAHTLGLLLEEKGYDKIKVAVTKFEPPKDKAAREARVAAFGEFVGKLDLKTDYALCAEFNIFADKSGIYVYLAMVNAKGHVVWQDSEEQRGRSVFDCLEVACNRLAPVLDLDKLSKKEMAADKKRMLQEARAKEPPSGTERKAMKERREALKKAGAAARVLVYPARVGGDRIAPNGAVHLSTLLNEARLCQATAAEKGPVIEGSGWPNEMQVLWLFARNVREYVREHPVDSDYVLFPDYWFNPRGQVWAVHFVVCNRAGEWVIVEMQNSHQEAFQRINPKNLEDCDRLVLAGSGLLGGGLTVEKAGNKASVDLGTGESRLPADKPKHVPGDLVMTTKDMPMDVGRRLTYALANPAGERFGEFEVAFVGVRTVGATKLCRQATRSGAMRVGDQWLAVGDDGFVVTDSFGAALPSNKYPLPLKVGMAFEYESSRGKVSAKVVGTEAVKVAAGEFACLAIVREREVDGRKRIERHWIAPGVGIVKISEEGFVVTLDRIEAPTKPKSEEGAVALSTFDTPDPLRSPLFPRAVWMGLTGELGQSSTVEIDPFVGGADGTPFCLRWTYAKSGTWASLPVYFGGDGQPPVDLSQYKGISFQIKSLLEQPCTVTIHANTVPANRRSTVSIPIQVTKEWQKIVLTPDTHPDMNAIDPQRCYGLSFDVQADKGTANVIWIDEVNLLLDETNRQF